MEREALREANTALKAELTRIEEEKLKIRKDILANADVNLTAYLQTTM